MSFFNIKLVLAECCPKHLKFTSQVLCFWYSTDSGGMPFQTFHVFNVFHSVALAPHWTHLSIYMLVLPKKRLGSVSVGILQKTYEWKLCFEYLGDLFPKDLLVWICSGDVLQQVSSRNIFGICQHIFYETFWETFQKNGNTMAPVRCCKNQIEFLWSIATRCLPEDVLLQIFGIIYIHARNMFEEYNCGYLQQVIEEYLRRLAKTCSEKLFSEVPPIWPGEKNIWETCPSYRFFRREMYSLFWLEI